MKSLKIFTVSTIIFYIVGNRCYNDKNKSKEIINSLIKNGIKTTLTEDIWYYPFNIQLTDMIIVLIGQWIAKGSES